MLDALPGASPKAPLLLEWWKPVVGFEKYYEVSSLGAIRSLARIKSNGRKMAAKYRKAMNATNGYLLITLNRDGMMFSLLVHKLVAEAFIGPRPLGLVINHKDENKKNPRASNLEYITQKKNIMLAAGSRGSKNFNAKLNEKLVSEIRKARGLKSQAELAAEYNVSRSLICMIQKYNLWHYAELV